MRARRTYGDPCGVARALDVVGERWALLVVRELLLGPKRFTDLRAGLPHVGPDMLSQRLRELEQSGVVRRGKLPPPAGSRVYQLTERGYELEPVVLALGRWGSAEPFPASDMELGSDAFVVALKTTFDPAAAADIDATVETRLGEDVFQIAIDGGRLRVQRGHAPNRPDATIDADVATLRELLWRGAPLDAALSSGRLRIDGDQLLARRFLELFPPSVPPGRDGLAEAQNG
jgi:DNA-binding HxlR family transcriptional regulator/putative sterol carrier protein